MPMPFPIAAAISGGAQLAGAGLNALATGRQNKRSRQFSREMYQRQYDDTVAFWNMQNEYNSPQQQMKRLQDAGLNPALMYGKAASPGVAGPMKTPDVQAPQFRTPDLSGVQNSGLAFMNALYDFDIKQAQLDNLKTDNTIKVQDAALRAAQVMATKTGTEREVFDLTLAKDLRSNSMDVAKEELRKLRNEADFSFDENQRKAAMNASNLKEAATRIIKMEMDTAVSKQQRQNMKQILKNLRTDNKLKELDYELWKEGISRNDPLWMRVLAMYLTRTLKFDSKKLTGFLGKNIYDFFGIKNPFK